MSDLDSFVRKHIAYPILPVVFLILILYLGKNYIQKLRKRLFASVLSSLGKYYEKASDKVKIKLFGPLHNIISGDKKLKNEGRIRILEIGIGTGMNFKYYPKSCQLIPVDSNEEVKGKLIENCKKYPHIEAENLVVAEAENLEKIDDNSIDAVVCTLLLCSARDPPAILKEIKRVLVPGGKFFFLEHVHAEDGTLLNKLQSALTVTYIWPILCLGCELNRHSGETILKAGFREVDLQRTEIIVKEVFIAKIARSHIYGVAVK